jgi:hypothetical protein
MVSTIDQLKIILPEALAKPSLPEREAYLDKVCAGQPTLREQVSILIEAYENAGDFLDSAIPFRKRDQ